MNAEFAERWISDWNKRDLDAILSHYAADIVMRSPLAVQLVGTGLITGKASLRDYWSIGLKKRPRLRFTLTGWYGGFCSYALHYIDERDGAVIETLEFDGDGLIARASAHYFDQPVV